MQLLVSLVFAPAEHDFIFSFDFRRIFWYFLVIRSIAGCRRSGVQLLVSSVFAPAEHDFIFSFDFRGIF